MSTVTRRRVGGSSNHPEDTDDNPTPTSSTNNNNGNNTPKHNDSPSSSEKKIAFDPRDLDESKANPKLTLMEEVLLLGLKDKQGYLSFWNDSISYALRGCIVMELAFRGRIAMVKDANRRKYPLSDRYIEVINDKLTGEVLLDEALKMMKVSEKMSVASWIDLMSGETWNVMKIGYQLKQVRERLAKGLVDKGVLRTEKRNFLLFDMATHPVADTAVKGNLIKLVCMMLTTHVSPSAIEAVTTDIPFAYLRTIAMICAAYAANVLENALLFLEPDAREVAFNKVDELMNDYSTWPFAGTGAAKMEVPPGTELSIEVMASVLNVLTKMDAIIHYDDDDDDNDDDDDDNDDDDDYNDDDDDDDDDNDDDDDDNDDDDDDNDDDDDDEDSTTASHRLLRLF